MLGSAKRAERKRLEREIAWLEELCPQGQSPDPVTPFDPVLEAFIAEHPGETRAWNGDWAVPLTLDAWEEMATSLLPLTRDCPLRTTQPPAGARTAHLNRLEYFHPLGVVALEFRTASLHPIGWPAPSTAPRYLVLPCLQPSFGIPGVATSLQRWWLASRISHTYELDYFGVNYTTRVAGGWIVGVCDCHPRWVNAVRPIQMPAEPGGRLAVLHQRHQQFASRMLRWPVS